MFVSHSDSRIGCDVSHSTITLSEVQEAHVQSHFPHGTFFLSPSQPVRYERISTPRVGPTGQAMIRSAWIIRSTDNARQSVEVPGMDCLAKASAGKAMAGVGVD